jgi:hypothetical protein
MCRLLRCLLRVECCGEERICLDNVKSVSRVSLSVSIFFDLEHHLDERNLQHVRSVQTIRYGGQQLNKQVDLKVYGPSQCAEKNSL